MNNPITRRICFHTVEPFLYIMPAIILLGMVFFIPIIELFKVSLYDAHTVAGLREFVGLKNFASLFSLQFLATLWRTAVYVGAAIPISVILGLFGAILLNQNIPGKRFLWLLAFIPWTIPHSISAILWRWLIHSEYGLLNHILMLTGILNEPVNFLSKDLIMTRRWKNIIIFPLAIAVVGILLFPLYSGFIASISPSRLVGIPSIFPQEFRFQNYIDIWSRIPLGKYMLNGLFYALMSTLIVLGVSVPASYALSRFRFIGKELFLMIVLVTQMFSVATIIVPIFLFIIKFNLFDTRAGVIFINSAISAPLGIWYMRAFFDKVPPELEEAGMVDGCTSLQAAIRLVLPVAVPGLVTSAIVVFTMSYKQFFIPLVLLSSAEKYPALVGVYTLANELAPPWELVMAAVFITILPPIALFFFTSRFVISGLSAGAIKG